MKFMKTCPHCEYKKNPSQNTICVKCYKKLDGTDKVTEDKSLVNKSILKEKNNDEMKNSDQKQEEKNNYDDLKVIIQDEMKEKHINVSKTNSLFDPKNTLWLNIARWIVMINTWIVWISAFILGVIDYGENYVLFNLGILWWLIGFVAGFTVLYFGMLKLNGLCNLEKIKKLNEKQLLIMEKYLKDNQYKT